MVQSALVELVGRSVPARARTGRQTNAPGRKRRPGREDKAPTSMIPTARVHPGGGGLGVLHKVTKEEVVQVRLCAGEVSNGGGSPG